MMPLDSPARIKHFTLVASEKVVQIAPDNALHPGGIRYNAMVFNGAIPGPVLVVDEGDIVQIRLKNQGSVIYSLLCHAATGYSHSWSGNIKPGESSAFTFRALNPGVFLYHSIGDGLNGMWEHIANGLYGGIVVRPKNTEPAKEFYVTFSEIYNSADKGPFVGSEGAIGSFDIGKLWYHRPDLILVNGMSQKYSSQLGQVSVIPLNPNAEIFKAKPGELTRWYIINAGPNGSIAFHFMAGTFDVVMGSDARHPKQKNHETWSIPPGSGAIIETVFPEEGLYIGIDHNMQYFLKGAGFTVLATEYSSDRDHPAGTWVSERSDEGD